MIKQTVKDTIILKAGEFLQLRKTQGAKTVKRNDVQAAIDAFLGRHSSLTIAFIAAIEQAFNVKYISSTHGKSKFVFL
jgi:hypothetical protein